MRTHLTLAAATLATATMAHAQPVFFYEAYDFVSGGVIASDSDSAAVSYEAFYGDVQVAIDAHPGGAGVVGIYFGPGPTGVTMTARSTCDDWIITGPAGPTVPARVNTYLGLLAQNAPSAGTANYRVVTPAGLQGQTLDYPVGNSLQQDVEHAYPTVNLPVGSPFSITYEVIASIGGTGPVQFIYTLGAGITPMPTKVLVLPDGYTVNSACASVINNRVVTCQPDLNADGIVDNGDISLFVSFFLAGDLAADFNGDGLLDNGDIGAFVEAFLAGC